MKKVFFAPLLATALLASPSAHAEIAILCGDQAAIEKDEKAALVHTDFDSETVKSRSEVKFFYQLGVEKKVKKASTDSAGNVLVTTAEGTFLFKNVSSCDAEGSVSVVVGGSQELSCACYSD